MIQLVFKRTRSKLRRNFDYLVVLESIYVPKSEMYMYIFIIYTFKIHFAL